MKKLFLSFLTVLLPMVALADAVEIDGIYYNLVSKAKQAEVTSNPNKYSGSVDIPTSVTFEGIDYNVTSIGKNAFYTCNSLASISIPNSVTSIEYGAFKYCSELTSISIPNSLTTIGDYAFEQCTSLTSINIPNSVTSIGYYAFYQCKSLSTIEITDIASWCSIKFSDISSNPVACGGSLYLNGEEIKELIIPNGVTTIGDYAFTRCTSMISVTIPGSVTSIGNSSFSSCRNLTSVTIPNSVTSIGICAFMSCSSLTSVTISNGVVSLGRQAFNYCTSLTSISIPNSVTSIGTDAFSGCSSLTSITIPNSVTSIDWGTFSYCSSLTTVTIPNSVTSIMNYAFYNCSSLTSIIIGNSVTTIETEAFAGCPELTDVYCLSENVPSTKSDAFNGSYIEFATLHVPASSINDYKEKEPWNNFQSIVSLEEETPKCATPTISYQNGQLIFESETEGVEFISDITDTDIKKHYDAKVLLTATYNITVYAKKSGYEDSDIATATLCWIDQQPETEGITEGLAQILARPVLIKTDQGQITVEGVDDSTNIKIFTTDGKLSGSATSQNGVANIDTHLPSGTTAIVKMGEKSVMVLVK